MGINVSLVKIGKNTKFHPKRKGDIYQCIDINWDEENDCQIYEPDEMFVCTERELSYLILYEILEGKFTCQSNDPWHVPLKVKAFKEEWKSIKLNGKHDIWVNGKYSPAMQKIVDELLASKTFYDLAVVIDKYKLDIGGF